MSKEEIFKRGLKVDMPPEKAPDFIVTKIALSPEIIELYEKNKNEKGWLNIDILQKTNKETKEEYHDWEINDWTPDKSKSKSQKINPDEIPF